MLLKYDSIRLCKRLFWAYGLPLRLGTVLRGTFPHKVMSECSILFFLGLAYHRHWLAGKTGAER